MSDNKALVDELRDEAQRQTGSSYADEVRDLLERAAAALSTQARPDGGTVVGKIVRQSGYWDRGHYIDRPFNEVRFTKEGDALPNDTKLYTHPTPDDYPEAAEVCAEAYQAVGIMLDDLDQFESERGMKLLDNLSQHRMVHKDVLPWPSMKPAPDVARLAEAGRRVTAAFRALGETPAWTRAAVQAHHECEAAMLALDAAIDAAQDGN